MFEKEIGEADLAFPEKNRKRAFRRKLKYKKHSNRERAGRYSGFMRDLKNESAFKQRIDEYVAEENRIRFLKEIIKFPIDVIDMEEEEDLFFQSA